MKDATTKVIYLLYYRRQDGSLKTTVMSKIITLPNMLFRPTYITIDDITFETNVCEYNVTKNQMSFINKMEYQHSELDAYKDKRKRLQNSDFIVDCEGNEETL